MLVKVGNSTVKSNLRTKSGLKGSSLRSCAFVRYVSANCSLTRMAQSMIPAHLNLARKWRSQNFDQIIGQDITVGILKNSLYLEKFFPVYLFAGQHGCGKTSTARVFAAAANCEQLPQFQKQPQNYKIPCGTCTSCTALAAGKHPDFIEMDAASHTGVDNVRMIIEAASLMPVLGRKKIYLIDEAHMLSKAAFNAFLKILEEPPVSVFFILATTDEHKIIDTVKSRCFQLMFNAVETTALVQHLHYVCTQENITSEQAALELIVKETRGSVRDAINLVEHVVLSKEQITTSTVLQVLGHMSQEYIQQLCILIFTATSPAELIAYMQQVNLASYNAEHVWTRILQTIHALLWLKYGATPTNSVINQSQLEPILGSIKSTFVSTVFQELCTQESVFLRTLNKPLFIQYLLVHLWQIIHTNNPTEQPVLSIKPTPKQPMPLNQNQAQTVNLNSDWESFVQEVEQLNEPLLSSLFKQAQFQSHETNIITIAFTQRFMLFNDTFETLKDKWLPVLQKIFGPQAQLSPQFSRADNPQSTVIEKTAKTPVTPVTTTLNNRNNIDVSDKNQWPLTNKLLAEFSGTVSVTEKSNS